MPATAAKGAPKAAGPPLGKVAKAALVMAARREYASRKGLPLYRVHIVNRKPRKLPRRIRVAAARSKYAYWVQEYGGTSQFVGAMTLEDALRIRKAMHNNSARANRSRYAAMGYNDEERVQLIKEARKAGRKRGDSKYKAKRVEQARKRYEEAAAVDFIADRKERKRQSDAVRAQGKGFALYMWDASKSVKLFVNRNGSYRPLPNPDAPGSVPLA